MIYVGDNDENNPNIIDVEGIEIDPTPDYGNEGDEVKMNLPEAEENKTKEGETKASLVPIKIKKKEKLTKKEKKNLLTKLKKLLSKRNITFGTIGLLALLCWNHDDIESYFKNLGNNEPKTNTEDDLNEEPNYEQALADNDAVIDEEEQYLEEGAIDEVIGGKVLAFTNASDDDQVYARASYIYTYLQASNVMDVTVEELCDQIKFINGTYNATTDDEAWDIYDDSTQTFADYSVATEQSANYAGNVVADNGVIVALGFDAFLTDNCEHRELMDEISIAFQNVLTATQGAQENKVDASKIMLKLEAELMLGQKETSNGTKIYFTSLTSSEAFIAGLMFQNANATIHSALGDNIELTYTDNIGQEVKVKYETLNEYYNPQCDGEYNTENAWAIVSTDLVETAIAKGLNLTFNQ